VPICRPEHAPLQIIWHTNSALNTDWTRQQIVEILTHISLFMALTNSMTALRYAKHVFDDRHSCGTSKSHKNVRVEDGRVIPKSRYIRGVETLLRLGGHEDVHFLRCERTPN
jgi:hypothetical protein